MRARQRTPQDTRLHRLIKSVPLETEWIDPLILPPWLDSEPHSAALARVGYRAGLSKEQAKENFLTWLAQIKPRDIVVYTDGSKVGKEENSSAGAGWVAYQAQQKTLNGRQSLGQGAEVYDAETFAASQGLESATKHFAARHADNIYICLDNLEVAARLLSMTTGSSQQTFTRFRDLAAQWPDRSREAYTEHGKIVIRWCPGHVGIPGNEEADQEARLAAEHPTNILTTFSLAAAKHLAKIYKEKEFTKVWATQAPTRYKDLCIPLKAKPPELSLSRYTLGKLYASRSGHGDFADYHERFDHDNAELFCSCNRRKTPDHFFFCTKNKKASRRANWHQPRVTIPEILGTMRGAKKFSAWLKETSFYNRNMPYGGNNSWQQPSPESTNNTDTPTQGSNSVSETPSSCPDNTRGAATSIRKPAQRRPHCAPRDTTPGL